jgi:hypothetical protein
MLKYKMTNIEKLRIGYAFLKANDFVDLFYKIQIPEQWHTDGAVTCIDEFRMETSSKITINDKIVGYGDESKSKNLTLELADLVGCTTCYSAAKYIYDLIIYVQKDDDGTVL